MPICVKKTSKICYNGIDFWMVCPKSDALENEMGFNDWCYGSHRSPPLPLEPAMPKSPIDDSLYILYMFLICFSCRYFGLVSEKKHSVAIFSGSNSILTGLCREIMVLIQYNLYTVPWMILHRSRMFLVKSEWTNIRIILPNRIYSKKLPSARNK